MTNEKRIEIEQRIVRRYIKEAQKGGWKPYAVYIEGEKAEWPGDLFAGDDATVKFVKEGEPGTRSFLYFVYGNEPGEVLCDYGVSMHNAIVPAIKYAEKWA